MYLLEKQILFIIIILSRSSLTVSARAPNSKGVGSNPGQKACTA